MNEIIMEKISSDGRVEMMCSVVAVFIMAFVVFYMFYSNNFFMRRRMKELGIYALLGYRKGDMLRLLTIENIFVCLGGMFVGILAGSLLHIGITAGIVALLGLTIDMGAIPFINPQAVSSIFLFILAVLLGWCIAISAIHHKRVWFVLRSQRKQLLFSVIFVLLPFICYTAVFFRKENYVEQMGLYLIVILTFVSIHSIIFRAKSQKPFFALSQPTIAIFLFGCIASFILIVWWFGLPILTAVTLLYLLVFCGLIYRLLLFWQANMTYHKNPIWNLTVKQKPDTSTI